MAAEGYRGAVEQAATPLNQPMNPIKTVRQRKAFDHFETGPIVFDFVLGQQNLWLNCSGSGSRPNV